MIPCPFSKTTAVAVSHASTSPPALLRDRDGPAFLAFDHICNTGHEFTSGDWGLKSEQEVVGYPHNSLVPVAPADASCLAVCYYSLQGSQLGKTTDVFSLPAASACTVSSVTRKANQQGNLPFQFQ